MYDHSGTTDVSQSSVCTIFFDKRDDRAMR